MIVYKLDNFLMFQISQCQMCEKKKTRVQKWDKLFDAWICINCWEKVVKECLSEKPYKIDKNGIEYVEIPHQMENEEVVKTNIAVIDLNRKLKQINSILQGKY
ncbi:hypothetical protein [Spiroplasma endosymbiont of Stenodema calcarata]|uniref:hypothetical protein n=1 Tax=Spiroplasma endosymbiont of Stenodema calcarata TaxID=3139328 RepID=UPI003CCA8159